MWIHEEGAYTNQAGDCKVARYVLGTEGKSPLLFFGINPSTATPGNPDPTIRKITAMTSHLKYDSWIMLNIYPQRAVKPDNLDIGIVQQIHNKNSAVIADVIKNYCPDHCAAAAVWGNAIDKRNYLPGCLKDIADKIQAASGKQLDWYCLGLTQKNNPKNPLFLSANTGLQPFDIDGYIQSKNKNPPVTRGKLNNPAGGGVSNP
jgi:hypothetical protein